MSEASPARIDRAALERIIQRAAELQTAEREMGDTLTSDELIALGREVGIPGRYLQQALLEERTRLGNVGARRPVRAGHRPRSDQPLSGWCEATRTAVEQALLLLDGAERAALRPAAAGRADHLGAARRNSGGLPAVDRGAWERASVRSCFRARPPFRPRSSRSSRATLTSP